MIKKMVKIKVLGPKSLMSDAINHLHGLGSMHIEEIPIPIAAATATDDDGAVATNNEPPLALKRIPLRGDLALRRDGLNEKLHKVETFLKHLAAEYVPLSKDVYGIFDEDSVDDFLGTAADDLTRSLTEYDEQSRLKEEALELNNYENLLKGFAPVISRLGGFKNFEIIGLTIDKSKSSVAELLEDEIKKITSERFEVHKMTLDEKTLGMAIVIANRDSAPVRNLLFGEGISELRLPSEYEDLPLVTALKNMALRGETLRVRLSEISESLGGYSAKYNHRLKASEKVLKDLIEEVGIIKFCAATKLCFIVEGWVPRDSYEGFKKSFAEAFSDKILVTIKDFTPDAGGGELKGGHYRDNEDDAPVYIYNIGPIRPFEVFLKAMPTPRYKSIDPTPFIAFFFPAFFGLIVGDIGYGAVIFLLALTVRFFTKDNLFFKDITSVFMVASLSAIFFGFLFGELFGDLGHRLHIIEPLWFDRAQSLKSFLVLAFGVGIGHVLLGFLLGFVNKLKLGQKKEAFGKVLFFFAIILLISMGLMSKEILPSDFFDTTLIVFTLLFAAMIVIEGILAPIEFVKAISSILSYVRIMAIGTSSVILATVANTMGANADSVVAGILIAVTVHIINILITIMSPSIQSMRLQYVEFMDKFYEEGGREYSPFKKR